MINDKPRTLLLATTAIATTFVLGKSIVYPEAKSSSLQNYTFPEVVTLSQWQHSFSKPAKPHLVESDAYISGNFIAGKHYRYRQNEKHVDIEMRYFSQTNGDLKSFITSQTAGLSPGLKQDNEGGFYSIYIHQHKAYLSACINSLGSSTVTSDQFQRNRMIYNTHTRQIVPWLLGQAEFRDKRCLWAHLSMPLDTETSVEETYLTLETVWFDWHDWWRSHFPDA